MSRRAPIPLSPGADRLTGVPKQSAGEPSAAVRQGLIWRLLTDGLSSVRRPGAAASVLDCGGGSGRFAVPLAELGAQVTVVDISADALATLGRRADEAAVGDRITAVQGDVEALTEIVATGSFDLVLAHGVLEAVDQPAVAFAGIAETVRAGGLLSVLLGNPVAAVLGRALAGELNAALAELHDIDADLGRLGLPGIRELCRHAGLGVEAVHGIGVFSELVPGSALDLPGARSALEQLESAAATRAPFADIASRVHVLARRPSPTTG
jgi:S-adenosylmethionine-dependent methyltransferase